MRDVSMGRVGRRYIEPIMSYISNIDGKQILGDNRVTIFNTSLEAQFSLFSWKYFFQLK